MSANGQGDFLVAAEIFGSLPKLRQPGSARLAQRLRSAVSGEPPGIHLLEVSAMPRRLSFFEARRERGPQILPERLRALWPAGSPTDPSEAQVPQKMPALRFLKGTLLKAVHGLNKAAARLSPDTLAEQLQKFYRRERDGATLLDFGCGTDDFLNHARSQGWNTLGMDVSPETIERVRP